MKYLIICLCLVSFGNLQAQNPFSTNDNIVVSGVTYKSTHRRIYNYVHNINNISITWDPANEPPAPQGCREMSPWMRINKSLLKDAVNSVFSPTRKAELYANLVGMSLTLYVNPSTGELVDVYFYIRHNSIITPTEVYQLDQALKGLMMPQCPECVAKSYIVIGYAIKWNE
jgi:hypothetical protein